MNRNSLMLLMGTLAAESILWLVVPGLATVVGVVLGLFMVASWREGSRRHSSACASFGAEDFQRRSSAITS
jgi:hypothetical protein